MHDLTAADFPEFFRDVHGYEPFPWQQRLAERVLGTTWPSVVDLPTGTGKTAVLDIAVYALAANPTKAPRRIVFVIDRRIVVDQVCKRAERIRKRIEDGDTGVLRRVRGRLTQLGGGKPLEVAALRGGIPINGAWAHRPDRPWVLVSTVDQFGSRLLFRGYGVGSRMLPIHAGLAGNDCLVILDEVHLSVPFAETLGRVADLPVGHLPRRFCIVQMSATPGLGHDQAFRLDPDTDLAECEELRRRVLAKKRAELVSVRNRDSLPSAVLKLARALAKPGSQSAVGSVGVVVNRVRAARDTHQLLHEAGFRVHLITGRMRPLDRIAALDHIQAAVDPDRSAALGEMTIVVATQAIEVGADFSFEALITECASIDSLRQRFGRLDRRGTSSQGDVSTRAWILGIKSELSGRRSDPIYGDSIKATWEELKRLERTGPIDVGPMSLAGFPQEAAARPAEAPLLLNTHLEAWVQTNPQPIVEPPIEWFLHGKDRNAVADVAIAWRRDRTDRALRLVPPRQTEYLAIPINAAKAWLGKGPETDVADVQGFSAGEETGSDSRLDGCVRWNGIGKATENLESLADILPGDTLIVSPDRGGLSSGTWDPSSTDPVEDFGDAAQAAYGRGATLRLDPRLPIIAKCSGVPPSPDDEDDADSPLRDRVREWLRLSQSDGVPEWLATVLPKLRRGFDCVRVEEKGGATGYYILTERHPDSGRAVTDPSVMDGSDEAGSMTGAAVTLDQHLKGVADRAKRTAERLGLSRDVVDDVWLAGRLHDLGKADRRFQAQLVGGDPIALEMLDEPLAKSLPGALRVRRYPPGMRHELCSVALVNSAPEVLAQAHDRELVLHLIATHHGWARPLPPIIEDPDPRTVSYDLNGRRLEAHSDLATGNLALESAERFWRLVARYGYYGLAWLETILRLADHRQSAVEDGNL